MEWDFHAWGILFADVSCSTSILLVIFPLGWFYWGIYGVSSLCQDVSLTDLIGKQLSWALFMPFWSKTIQQVPIPSVRLCQLASCQKKCQKWRKLWTIFTNSFLDVCIKSLGVNLPLALQNTSFIRELQSTRALSLQRQNLKERGEKKNKSRLGEA